MRKLGFVSALSFALALTLAAPHPGSGQALGLDFGGVTQNFTTGASWNLGWTFNVVNKFTVFQLGVYDDFLDGLTESHQVGIWDPFGVLLASTTVAAGTGAPTMGFFRMMAIAPVTLAVGNGYRVSAVMGGENYTWDPTGVFVNPNLQYVADAFSQPGTGFVYPNESSDPGQFDVAVFGGNFAGERVVDTVVPEPSTVILLGTGLLGIGFFGWRKKEDEEA